MWKPHGLTQRPTSVENSNMGPKCKRKVHSRKDHEGPEGV